MITLEMMHQLWEDARKRGDNCIKLTIEDWLEYAKVVPPYNIAEGKLMFNDLPVIKVHPNENLSDLQ